MRDGFQERVALMEYLESKGVFEGLKLANNAFRIASYHMGALEEDLRNHKRMNASLSWPRGWVGNGVTVTWNNGELNGRVLA